MPLSFSGSATAPPTPVIGVHLLSQFEFCPRAAVVTFEQTSEDSGEDEAPQRLDYLPDYDERLIRDRLNRMMNRFWLLSLLLGAGLYGVCYASSWKAELLVLAMLPAAVVLYYLFSTVASVAILRRRLDAAVNSAPREPDPLNPVEESLNWWELRKAGYEVIRLSDSMTDSDIGMVGKPWRLLRKGDLFIPVFRKHWGDRLVHSQHRIRMAAYCDLTERSTGGKSPFGIVLFAGGNDVLVLPATRQGQDNYSRVLQEARASMSSFVRRCEAMPAESAACLNCPHGRPEQFSKLKEKTSAPLQTTPVRIVVGISGERYHSLCGDRFQWIPPHTDAIDQGLLQ